MIAMSSTAICISFPSLVCKQSLFIHLGIPGSDHVITYIQIIQKHIFTGLFLMAAKDPTEPDVTAGQPFIQDDDSTKKKKSGGSSGTR